MRLFISIFILFVFVSAFGSLGYAQYVKKTPGKVAVTHAQNIGKVCIGNWESPACIKATGESNLVLAANYAEKLHGERKVEAVNTIKELCAASTAGSQMTDIPKHALISAYTECANTIYDVSEQTGVKPDESHYQLLIAPILCLNEDRRCASLEQQMKRYLR